MAVISRDDAGTGIQRVARALAHALIDEEVVGWDIRVVSASRARGYHEISWGEATDNEGEHPVEGQYGDVFLGLDFSLNQVRWHRKQLARFRKNGGSVWFVVYDLLPIEHPEWFSGRNVLRFKIWLETIAGIADGFFCISAQTESDLTRALSERFALSDGYTSSIIPMGYDIREAPSAPPSTNDREPRVPFDASSPFVLMVGTLEPRKGHADILAAFEGLWRQGIDSRLVLVGRAGWKTQKLCDTIRKHPEHGSRLLWLNDVTDHELEEIYASCQGVIVGSHGEGFGLPLIEALGYGKPVLARDLPVFRAHQKLGVCYFPSDCTPEALSSYICDWLHDVASGQSKVTKPTANWADAAKTVFRAIA